MSQLTPILCLEFLLLLTPASCYNNFTKDTTTTTITTTTTEPEVNTSSLIPSVQTKDVRRYSDFNVTTFEHMNYLLYDKGGDKWIPIPNSGILQENLWNYRSSLKVLIHGYNSRPMRDPNQVMESMMIIGQEYARKNESLNIVAVNWMPLATRPVLQYPEAAANTRDVGIAVAIFLRKLKAQRAFINWRKVHIIGFSLGQSRQILCVSGKSTYIDALKALIGAHVAGVAGQEILKLTHGRKIGRISGLDPGPEFDGKDNYRVLDRSDARFVDIIHCNMATLASGNFVAAALVGTYGSGLEQGHADFYPNGGERQTYQCSEIQDRTGCSHNMCALFYALSLREKLAACPCDNWSFYVLRLCPCTTGKNGKAEYMGELSDRRGTARGKYYLTVSNKVTKNMFRH